MNKVKEISIKKSVDDLITNTQDVFTSGISQAIGLTYSGSASGSKSSGSFKRSPSPSNKSSTSVSARSSFREQHEQPATTTTDVIELDFTDAILLNPELKLQDDVKDKDGKDKRPGSSKLAEKAKKKAWYSVLYPSYKSRAEDFKKLFKDVPDEERLVVDYSCAIQKDILVHGRLYVSQNYLCFHANIIVYETKLTLRWKDITSISKEKVAKVIPNAILLTTKTEKHFLTSFTARDKTHLMLFRVWQNALMDTPMNPQELWQWVHSCYGEQLGLTSDDDDSYVDPTEDTIDLKLSADSISEDPSKASSSSSSKQTDTKPIKKDKKEKLKKSLSDNSPVVIKLENQQKQLDQQQAKLATQPLPPDMSDSTDSDADKNKMEFINNCECNSMHEGRQLVHTILPINIETLFGLMFAKSKFFSEFHNMRKTTDLVQGEWEDGDDGVKHRVISLTVAITQTVGPKSSNVTETQTMRNCSRPGQLYSIDATSVNAGIPYADSFYVVTHYCMKRTNDDHTVMSVHAQVKYKKSVWGVVKGFIEKNTWVGLEDFYMSLSKALAAEYNLPQAKAKSRKRRTTAGNLHQLPSTQQPALPTKQQSFEENQTKTSTTKMKTTHHKANVIEEFKGNRNHVAPKHNRLSWVVIGLLVALIFFNVILYIKLWNLEDKQELPDLATLKNPPKTPDEWLKLLQLQESLHSKEMHKWQRVLTSAIELLRKTENSLSELQHLILNQRSKTPLGDTFANYQENVES